MSEEKLVTWEEALVKNITKVENNYREKDNTNLVVLPNGVKRYREPGRGLYNKLQHGAISYLTAFVKGCIINNNFNKVVNIGNIYEGFKEYYLVKTDHDRLDKIVKLTLRVIDNEIEETSIDRKVYKAIDMVAKRCEEGARKYDDADNWRKGIPCDWLIDSSLRHYNNLMLKSTDDDHLSALLWNLFTLIEIILMYKNRWISERAYEEI